MVVFQEAGFAHFQVTLHSNTSGPLATDSGGMETSILVRVPRQLRQGLRACPCPSLTKQWHQQSSLAQGHITIWLFIFRVTAFTANKNIDYFIPFYRNSGIDYIYSVTFKELIIKTKN